MAGEGFLGDRIRRTTALGSFPPPSREQKEDSVALLRRAVNVCSSCWRDLLWNQKLKTHRLRGEGPVCFEMLTVAFCPCQPEPHLRQGLLFHIFLDKISWLTARALPCRCPSAQSTCRVPGRGAELTGEETGSPNWNGAGALQDVDW